MDHERKSGHFVRILTLSAAATGVGADIVLARTGHMSPLERPEQLSHAIAQPVSDTAGAAEVAAAA
jgi:hypothetical protein